MLSIVEELMKPRRKGRKIKVEHVLSKNIVIARFASMKVPRPSAYEELEGLIADYYKRVPGWNFQEDPYPGMFVIVIGEGGDEFLRGVILLVENSVHGIVYFVYTYDHGNIRKVDIHHLANLPGEFRFRLEPRTFIVVLAGMVSYKPHLDRFRDESESSVEIASASVGKVDPMQADARKDPLVVAAEWLQSTKVLVEMYKAFNQVVYVADIRAVKVVGVTPEDKKGEQVFGERYVDFMEKEKLSALDRRLREADKDPKQNKWDPVGKRLEKYLMSL